MGPPYLTSYQLPSRSSASPADCAPSTRSSTRTQPTAPPTSSPSAAAAPCARCAGGTHVLTYYLLACLLTYLLTCARCAGGTCACTPVPMYPCTHVQLRRRYVRLAVHTSHTEADDQPLPRPATSHIPHPTSHVLRPTSHIPHPTSHIPHPTSHVPRPTSHIPHPTSCIPRPTSHIPHPTSYILQVHTPRRLPHTEAAGQPNGK